MPTAVITGIKGQIASYAADRYIAEGYNVIGLYRECATNDFTNIKHLLDNKQLILHEADICDFTSITNVIKNFHPDLWLNFAAASHVGSSYHQPITTTEVNYLGVLKTLEAIRLTKPNIKFWNANTSERFGDLGDIVQDENVMPSPVSPYAVAKVAAEYAIKAYRKTYGLHASYSIMFNTESPRRGRTFVTRKITDYIGRSFNLVEQNIEQIINLNQFLSVEQGFISCLEHGIIEPLRLGTLDTFRSWTHAKDTVDGIYRQMQLDIPDDFVFGREETHSIREFLDTAFNVIGIKDWSKLVTYDERFVRPSDVPVLKPTCNKAHEKLNWYPSVSFEELVKEMVQNDIKLYSNGNR